MRFLPSAGVPTLPSAVAAAPRTPSSGSLSAATSCGTSDRPSRMPTARAAYSRMCESSSFSALPRAWYAAGSTAT
jgi:hypothetical protein